LLFVWLSSSPLQLPATSAAARDNFFSILRVCPSLISKAAPFIFQTDNAKLVNTDMCLHRTEGASQIATKLEIAAVLSAVMALARNVVMDCFGPTHIATKTKSTAA